MPIVFDLGKVLKYYSKARAEGRAKVTLSRAMEEFNIEEAIKKAEKLVKNPDNVYLVPCVTGETGVKEVDGELFVEIC